MQLLAEEDPTHVIFVFLCCSHFRSRGSVRKSRLAAMERAKCLITIPILVLLLKSNISSLDDQVYNNDDMEVIVKHYLGFLVACAHQTNRLTSKLVASAAKEVFGCSDFVGKKFGEVMASALSFCYSKAGKASSGKKLSQSVKSVILSFNSSACAAINKIQDSLKLPLSPEPKIATSTSSSSVDTASSPQLQPTSASGIYQLYGITDLPKSKKPKIDHENVLSSQEIFSSQEQVRPSAATRIQANNDTNCFEKLSPD
jgi:hypothetical protein